MNERSIPVKSSGDITSNNGKSVMEAKANIQNVIRVEQPGSTDRQQRQSQQGKIRREDSD